MVSEKCLFVVIFILLPSLAISYKLYPGIQEYKETVKCKSYDDICPKLNPDKEIHVHIVPHSHDDMGWLKNIDEYYYGMKSTIQRAGVQYILDSVIKELYWDPEKR